MIKIPIKAKDFDNWLEELNAPEKANPALDALLARPKRWVK